MYKSKKHNSITVTVTALALTVAMLFVSLTSCRPGNDTESGSDTRTESAFGTTTAREEVTTSPASSAADTTTAPETSETTKTPDTTDTAEVTTEPVTTPAVTETQAPETTLPPVESQTSGVFHAETGTSLGFRVEWELVGFEGDKAIINTRVILSSYQLYISARRNLGVIRFGDNEVRFSTDRITQDQNKKVDILLTEQQVKVDTDNGFAIVHFEVSWFFNASYAGTDYEWIGAGGYISLNKQ